MKQMDALMEAVSQTSCFIHVAFLWDTPLHRIPIICSNCCEGRLCMISNCTFHYLRILLGFVQFFGFGGDDYNYILFWHLFPPVDVHSANPFFFYHWNTSTTCRRVLTGILNVCFVVHWIMTAISLLLQFLFPLRHTAFEEKTTKKGYIGGRLAFIALV